MKELFDVPAIYYLAEAALRICTQIRRLCLPRAQRCEKRSPDLRTIELLFFSANHQRRLDLSKTGRQTTRGAYGAERR